MAPYNDLEATRGIVESHADDLAAIIVEPIQRIISPAEGFLEGLRELCDEHGVVLIFDEVVTGFRLGIGGAQEFYGVTPDLVALGKALSGGMSIAALAGKKAIMEYLDPNSGKGQFAFHCGTLNGNILSVEAAHTCLDILIEEEGLEHLCKIL